MGPMNSACRRPTAKGAQVRDEHRDRAPRGIRAPVWLRPRTPRQSGSAHRRRDPEPRCRAHLRATPVPSRPRPCRRGDSPAGGPGRRPLRGGTARGPLPPSVHAVPDESSDASAAKPMLARETGVGRDTARDQPGRGPLNDPQIAARQRPALRRLVVASIMFVLMRSSAHPWRPASAGPYLGGVRLQPDLTPASASLPRSSAESRSTCQASGRTTSVGRTASRRATASSAVSAIPRRATRYRRRRRCANSRSCSGRRPCPFRGAR